MEEKETLTTVEENGTSFLPPKITKENIDPLAGTKKSVALYWVKAVVFTLLSSLLVAIAAYSLIAPNNFTIGGISGVAILINVASNDKIPQSLLVIALNSPLILLSFFFVKRRFAVLTTLNTAMQSVWLLILEKIIPDFKIIFPGGYMPDGVTLVGGEASKLFAAVAAGICIGSAIVLAFKVGGSTGGADILAVMIQKKIAAGSIAWILFAINCFVIGVSVFILPCNAEKSDPLYYGALFMPVVLSALESYIESKTNESMTNGFTSAVEFRIITEKPDEMAAALMKELSRGVTSVPAKGMYTKEERSMLVCVVSKRQIATVRRITKEIDPDSFAVMSKVSQVLGLGFYTQEL